MTAINDSALAHQQRPKRKSKKTIGVLLSCCVFLTIICACLLTALILIGKHLLYNATTTTGTTTRPVQLKTSLTRNNINRLPNDTLPISYDITLKPNLTSGIFDGAINITINITRPRREILLHEKYLNISAIKLERSNDSKPINISTMNEIPGDELIVIITENLIDKGVYFLYINYSGNMLNKTKGLYRSQYKKSNSSTNEKRYIATSKFEPTYARQAYPCFDEPNLKATYKVHLLKPADPEYIALSNNPQMGEDIVSNGVMVHFQETVPMSTYLSCFIVSDFKHTTYSFDNAGEQIPFRVFASPEQLDKTVYAGGVGRAVIEYYVNYFNIPYPLPKLDMVAIPDFVSGAMEHWGLVTYRETALLYSDKTHSTANKQRVATVVAHELAHSWFGNLVTMDWWDNLWLNEGFASYIEFKGVLAAEPTWQMLEQFQTSDLHPLLDLDATQGSHPIIQTVITPDQITEVFDTISYNKGASVLRMLEDVVGEQIFQLGVTNYLKKFAYGNAVTKDLLTEIQSVLSSDLDITEFMDTFTVQMGIPILTATVNGNQYTFEQKRFLINPDSIAKKKYTTEFNYRWNVPITYITDKSSTKSEIVWFNHNDKTATVTRPDGVKWIKFNPGQIGYYRINYPESEWHNLITNALDMTMSDRAHLLEESFSIAESGQLSYRIPLDLTKYLVNEFGYTPWVVASNKLRKLITYLDDSQYSSNLKTHIINILKPAYDKVTWTSLPDDTHTTKLARTSILSLACQIEYEDALNKAKDLFNNFITNNVEIDQDLRSIVYQYGMFTADEATWDKLFQLFDNEQDANEKLKLMNGLASVRNVRLLNRLLGLAKDETYIRNQDYFSLLQYISSNQIGKPIVWDYVREHWQDLVSRFTLNDRNLGGLLPAITKQFSSKTKLEEIQHFFTLNPEAGAGAANRIRAVETVQNNINWLKKYKTVVETWLNENIAK